MHKIFITVLSLGLLLTAPSLIASSDPLAVDLPATSSSIDSFDGIPTVDSVEIPGSESASSPSSLRSTDSALVSSIELFKTHSTLSAMSSKDKAKLAKRLDSHKSIELRKVIPEEKIEQAIHKDSCCCVCWKICFKASVKTLGALAIDIILDLSDGNLNGVGVTGPVNYIDHLINIINETIDEIMNEAMKSPKKESAKKK